MNKTSHNARARWVTSALAATGAGACVLWWSTNVGRAQVRGAVDLSPFRRVEVARWFSCTECDSTELRNVTALGNAVVADLALAFNEQVQQTVLNTYRAYLRE